MGISIAIGDAAPENASKVGRVQRLESDGELIGIPERVHDVAMRHEAATVGAATAGGGAEGSEAAAATPSGAVARHTAATTRIRFRDMMFLSRVCLAAPDDLPAPPKASRGWTSRATPEGGD